MGDAYLGIDIGTSGAKAVALSGAGDILAAHTAEYGLSHPAPGWSEQDPADWVEGARRAVAAVLRTVPAAEIAAVGLSGQMHGLTPLDADHRVIRPAILWNDQRNEAEAHEITEAAGGAEALRGMTANPMLVGYTGGKILWLLRHEPQSFERMRHALNPKDYLRLVLTGEVATEVSDASGTGLFDVAARRWSRDLLGRLPFDAELLPECHESTAVTGRVSASAAEAFGLAEGTPVVGGGGDAVVQTLGSGVIAPGELQSTIGTAGIMAAAVDAPTPEPEGRLQVFCNVEPGLWHCMGVSLNAGGALGWLRGALGGADFDALTAAAARHAPGAEGLLFLPYLNGERCPHPDPLARGAFVGLTARHDRGAMTRAVMEGVVHALHDMHLLMRGIGIEGRVVKASGGGARSALWRQMQADLLDCEVQTTSGAAEGGAFGAALLAGVGVGRWRGAAEAAGACQVLTRQHPDPAAGEVYRRAHAIYAALYPALRETFAALAEIGPARGAP